MSWHRLDRRIPIGILSMMVGLCFLTNVYGQTDFLQQVHYTKELGGGHAMETHLRIAPDGKIQMDTITYTRNQFAGYYGCVEAVLYDRTHHVVYHVPRQRYGVNGILFGQSRRVDRWEGTMDPKIAYQVRRVEIDLSRCSE